MVGDVEVLAPLGAQARARRSNAGSRTNAPGSKTMNTNGAKGAASTTPSSWPKPGEEPQGSRMGEVADRHEQHSHTLSV